MSNRDRGNLKIHIRFRALGIAALLAYSGVLLAAEIFVSQEYARLYFTDIHGPVRFYAVNTTVSVIILWSTALIFYLCVRRREILHNERKRLFFLSQALIFSYLAFDDRFMIHEAIGTLLGVEDALILAAVGAAEIALLITLGRSVLRPTRNKMHIGLAGVCFLAMLLVDGLVPSDAVPRLAVEDLFKTWACFFLFLFAWDVFGQETT